MPSTRWCKSSQESTGCKDLITSVSWSYWPLLIVLFNRINLANFRWLKTKTAKTPLFAEDAYIKRNRTNALSSKCGIKWVLTVFPEFNLEKTQLAFCWEKKWGKIVRGDGDAIKNYFQMWGLRCAWLYYTSVWDHLNWEPSYPPITFKSLYSMWYCEHMFQGLWLCFWAVHLCETCNII